MVQSGLNTEALRYLKKAEKIVPDNMNIKYKLAIILSDLAPEESIEYIEKLLEIEPQNIDYNLYNKAVELQLKRIFCFSYLVDSSSFSSYLVLH